MNPVEPVTSAVHAQSRATTDAHPGGEPRFNDFSRFDLAIGGGRLPASVPESLQVAPSLQAGPLANAIHDGLKNGFSVPHMNKFLDRMATGEITHEQMPIELVKLSVRSEVGNAYLQISKQMAESVNNIVTKQ